MSEQIQATDASCNSTKTEKINLLNLNRQQMRELFAEMGEKPFRADQLMKWIYHFGEDNFDNISGMSLLASFMENVYLDAMGEKPLFVLNLDRLVKYLNTKIPF